MKKRIAVLALSMCLLFTACGNNNINIFNDAQDYVINNQIVPVGANLVYKGDSTDFDSSSAVREVLYETGTDTYLIKIETVGKNKVHCTVYEDVSYVVKESKDSHRKEYKIKYESSEVIWNKVIRYGDIIVEDWVESVDNEDSGSKGNE